MNLLQAILRKPPQVFPFIGLFHIAMLLYALYNYSSEPMGLVWFQVLWVLVYTILWLWCCTLNRWALYGYLLMATINIALRFLLKDQTLIDLCLDAIFPMDILFSFFLLFHFKKFT